MNKTDSSQFERFLKSIPPEIIPNVHFIPLPAEKKKPPSVSLDKSKGEEATDEKFRLSTEQALERIKTGKNVGIYAKTGGVLFFDMDTDKGKIIIPEEIRNTFERTLTIKTRNGGLQKYYINNGKFKNKIHCYNGVNSGEIRADFYYGLSPGSYVAPDKNATPEATGLYTIVDDAPMVEFTQMPKGITVKEDIPKKEIKIDTKQSWKNDIGISLDEIRKKDDKLDKLLSGAHDFGYPSRSEADMAAAQKLYFWRFNESEIAGILHEYRPYEKTARQDYIETTISKILPGERYNPEHKNNNVLDVGELPEITQQRTKQASLNLTGLKHDNYLIKHISYATKMTDSYVDYHVGNALFILAHVSNRKIKVCFAHETIYPNICSFLIGDSTVARKTASINIGFDKIALPVFGTSGFLPQSSSPESLIEELSNSPKSSLVRDEAGGFLRELDKNYMQGMKDTLCALYDNRDYHRKIRTGQRKGAQTDFNIKNPFINLLFATTPDVFKNYCNLLDITSGWLVRFLYFTPDHEKEWRGYRKETIEDINIRDDVRRCLELIKLRVDSWQDEKEFILTDEAMQFFTEWQKRTEMEAVKNRDKNKLRILGRLHTYAVKMAMLFTLGDNTDNTEISKNYIEIACRLIEDYFVITACTLLDDISRDAKHNVQDKIIEILKTYGRVNIRDILRYTHRPKKEIAEALEALDERGSYELKTTKSESGKTIYYELNGFKTKNATVTSVTGVASVATVPTVPEIQGINATVVTDDIHSRDAQANLGRYSCDKSDKCDSCDSSDTSDNKTVTELSKSSFRDFGVRAKDWMCYNSKSITKETLTEASMWIAESVKANPSDVRAYLIREYAIAIEPGV